MDNLLKTYLMEIQAARITRKNFKALQAIDSDAVLLEDDPTELYGEWFVIGPHGSELMPGHIELLKGPKHE